MSASVSWFPTTSAARLLEAQRPVPVGVEVQKVGFRAEARAANSETSNAVAVGVGGVERSARAPSRAISPGRTPDATRPLAGEAASRALCTPATSNSVRAFAPNAPRGGVRVNPTLPGRVKTPAAPRDGGALPPQQDGRVAPSRRRPRPTRRPAPPRACSACSSCRLPLRARRCLGGAGRVRCLRRAYRLRGERGTRSGSPATRRVRTARRAGGQTGRSTVSGRAPSSSPTSVHDSRWSGSTSGTARGRSPTHRSARTTAASRRAFSPKF